MNNTQELETELELLQNGLDHLLNVLHDIAKTLYSRCDSCFSLLEEERTK